MMSFFDRKLPAPAMARLEENLRNIAWLADLFGRWRPAGTPLDVDGQSKGLRLAIRNGYLNFYRCGQSIARVTFAADGSPRAETHHKYLTPGATGQRYAQLKTEHWSGLDRSLRFDPATFDRCIEQVHDGGHDGAEKTFVERVVAANPNVIDMEMGLPAGLRVGNARVAPRMDLVALELDEHTHGRIQVVFWEAKGVTDGRMRCRDPDGTPEVVDQLRKYSVWIDTQEGGESNVDRVSRAYREVCRLLGQMHEAATGAGIDVPPLGPLIRMVATSDERLGVDQIARLLVDASGDDRKFVTNGHLAKLEREPHRLLVQMVRGAEDLHLATFHDLRSALPWKRPAA
jgi:hypothetical protein